MNEYTVSIINRLTSYGKIEWRATLLKNTYIVKESKWCGMIDAHLDSLAMLNDVYNEQLLGEAYGSQN